MKQKPTKLGGLAVLLLVISICIVTLGVLTFSTAQADLRLAERYGETTAQQYQRERAGQAFLSEVRQTLDAGGTIGDLPDVVQNGDIYEKTFSVGNAVLCVGIREDGQGRYEVVRWETKAQWSPQQNTNNLWGG